MSFMTLPPEINSLLMYTGAGSGPMLQAAAAWNGLSAELGSAAESFSSVISGLAGQAWQGAASRAMTSAAAPYLGWLSAAASQASGAATQAQAVASEFEAALAATVHPLAVQANRNGVVQLVMIQPVWAKLAGDRGGRGLLRGDVGPGRVGDAGLSRRGAGGGHAIDVRGG